MIHFFKTNSVWFYPRSLGYLVPGFLVIKAVSVFLVGNWILSQFGHCLTVPIGFVPQLTFVYIVAWTYCRSKDFLAGLMSTFIFSVLCGEPSHTEKIQNIRVKAPCRQHLDLSMFSELYVSLEMNPCYHFSESNHCLSKNFGCLEKFMGPFSQQLDWKTVQPL